MKKLYAVFSFIVLLSCTTKEQISPILGKFSGSGDIEIFYSGQTQKDINPDTNVEITQDNNGKYMLNDETVSYEIFLNGTSFTGIYKQTVDIGGIAVNFTATANGQIIGDKLEYIETLKSTNLPVNIKITNTLYRRK